jgi:hypothetical protein
LNRNRDSTVESRVLLPKNNLSTIGSSSFISTTSGTLLYYRCVIVFGCLIVGLTIITSFVQILETFQSGTKIGTC